MTNVVMVDVRGLISKSGPDVLKRHNEYGKALKRADSRARLFVLSRYSFQDNNSYPDMEIISYSHIISYLFGGARFIRSLSGKIVLVSGDPWESFAASVFLKRLALRKLSIQVQIHADVGSVAWQKLNFRNRIRSKLLFFALGRADQVRCVSNEQKSNLNKIKPGIDSRIVVIPVPINVSLMSNEKRKNQRKCSIAIVGRIHKDRGLQEFVKVCTVLSSAFADLEIYVVGEGPHKEFLEQTLKDCDLLKISHFLGNRTQEELSWLWKEFGCIASFAPSESFGRTAREALVYGVPVLAKHSSGMTELHELFDENGIWFIENKDDEEIVSLFKFLTDFVVSQEVSDEIVKRVKSLSDALAQSWIACANLAT